MTIEERDTGLLMLLAAAGPVDDLIVEHVADTLTVTEALGILDRREPQDTRRRVALREVA